MINIFQWWKCWRRGFHVFGNEGGKIIFYEGLMFQKVKCVHCNKKGKIEIF